MTTIVRESVALGKGSANRDEALQRLVPKILGIILVEGGKLSGLGGRSVRLNGGLELSASGRLGPHRIMLSAYRPSGETTVKVLSLHITDEPRFADPAFYRYVDKSIAVLSWRRGDWEEIVLNHPGQEQSTAELLASGVLAAE
ncbi:hypothetical protein [Bradyrhizobium sp. OAE829]|uniref:hypothetical protein n=1 Tax=Bradyrhizobium sp. OAE829 TaxID=2663807 RepID=UPI00178B4477